MVCKLGHSQGRWQSRGTDDGEHLWGSPSAGLGLCGLVDLAR